MIVHLEYQIKSSCYCHSNPVQDKMYSRMGVGGLYLEPYLAILPNRELLLLSHYYCVQGGMFSRVVEACALEPDLAILPTENYCYSPVITVCRAVCTRGWWRPVPWSLNSPSSPTENSCCSPIITVCRGVCTRGWWRPVPWSLTSPSSPRRISATLLLLLCAGWYVLEGGGGLCLGA